jgi:hypothetical protein
MESIQVLHELNEKWQKRYQGLIPLHFSHWITWTQRGTLSDLDKVGVYILAKYSPNEKIPDYIEPLDNHVIYFGKTNVGTTTCLKKRLNQFDGAIFGRGDHHAGGETYRKKYGEEVNDLYVSICPIYWNDENSVLYEVAEVLVKEVITRFETCLRGIYIYQWGNLPKCNKE